VPVTDRVMEQASETGGDHPHSTVGRRVGRAAGVGLAVGALGVVFGDIGTSPLYALQTVFSIDGGAVRPTPGDVYGVLSLVFWSITVVVSVKYVLFVMRADNDGEGGVLALTALLRRLLGSSGRRAAVIVTLGLLGACLFYGDSLITPAISVLSAVEGLSVETPSLSHLTLPISAVILTVLFVGQRWGTHRVGQLFGPVMVVWFLVLAALGIPEIARQPAILRALSPTYIVTFVAAHPYTTFVAMGAVVLAITGAEALYADMGHFGRPAISKAWFALVLPALVLNYFGQGALILRHPASAANPFYLLVPSWGRTPMVVLATLATVIASQAVISGAFSVSHQAVRLGALPHLTVKQTSDKERGQIYVPAVNWLLFVGVIAIVFGFRSSARLATAYGVAVTGTFLITTALLLIAAHSVWRWARWKLVLAGVVFGVVEVVFFAANLTKVVHGGWLPLSVAIVLFLAMTTWERGRHLVTERRIRQEGTLTDFVAQVAAADVARVPGTAVFPHPGKDTTPLALRASLAYNHVLHEHVVIISVQLEGIPHVPEADRIVVENLGDAEDGIVHLTARSGFQDHQNIPRLLRTVRGTSTDLQIDVDQAYYFLSRISIHRGPDPELPDWRKRIFLALAGTAADPADYFHLPDDRTVTMSFHVDL
jgi:KUP system potassium uptake protein